MTTVLSFSGVGRAARTLWAKSGEAVGHGLLAHMLDVAAVAETIIQRESDATRQWIADALGLPMPAVSRWLGLVAGLHDFGKGIPGFQAKWPDGQGSDEAAGLRFSPRSPRPRG
jgi:CRISPR-associated endonuclease/helicase Cas3